MIMPKFHLCKLTSFCQKRIVAFNCLFGFFLSYLQFSNSSFNHGCFSCWLGSILNFFEKDLEVYLNDGLVCRLGFYEVNKCIEFNECTS